MPCSHTSISLLSSAASPFAIAPFLDITQPMLRHNRRASRRSRLLEALELLYRRFNDRRTERLPSRSLIRSSS